MRPIPHISKHFGAAELARLYLDTDRACPDPEGRPPGLIVALPPAWGNKYQLLLYEAAAEHRCAVIGVREPADLAAISWPGPVLLHAHWFGALFDDAGSEAGARARLCDIQADIRAFRERTGARLLWTAHNLFPHGTRFPETFLELRRWIFEDFDAVHLLDPGHLDLLETGFGRRAPASFTVPHMTYEGIVPDVIGRAAARARFGIPPQAFVVGMFGSIQAYKAIPQVLETLAAMQQEQGARATAAIVAGVPSDPRVVREIGTRWGGAGWLHFLPQTLPDHEIQYVYRAADVMVLAYETSLNSGAALMAATFGTPFLMPDGPSAAGLEGGGRLGYDPDGGLAGALAALRDAPAKPPAPADPAWRRARAPAAISRAFMAEAARLFMPEPSA